MAIPIKLFAQRLLESGLMTADEVLDLRKRYPERVEIDSAMAFAQWLIDLGKLTPFQADRICKGEHLSLMLGNNVLLEKIGEGGMGEVFKAEHRRMKRRVVVKVLRPELLGSDYAVRRFQREVHAAAQLVHPNIVTAYDADESGELHFLVMEYVDGVDLGTLVSRDGPLSPLLAVRYVLQAARGLEYAHRKGIVHRDIKPSNLLLDQSGTIKVLDMGLARFDTLEEQPGDHLTQENQIIGTVDYMAPEQANDPKAVDRRSDIYSLGCTFYRLLSGRVPYSGSSPFMVLLAHQNNPAPSLIELLGPAAKPLDAIFQKMVAKLPEHRYQSASDLIRDLEQLLPRETRGVGLAGTKPGHAGHVPDAGLIHAKAESIVSPTASFDDGVVHELRRGATGLHPTGRGLSLRLSGDAGTPIGIDLGTTNSLAARLDESGRPVTIVSADGELLTPSVVLFDDDSVIVGREAVRALATERELIAESPKRQLGALHFDKSLRGKLYPPEVLQAFILNKLRLDIERQTEGPQPVVITVPAYFDEVRRRATADAGYIAGLDVLDVLNEPTAAALAYGILQGIPTVEGRPARLLVYDLGGGTFDVTVMEIDGSIYRMLATDGDMQLGGRDWDQRLVDYLAEQFLRQHGIDPREDTNQLGRMWRDCEEAKRTLSVRQRTHLNCDYRGCTVQVEVTRTFLQEITRDLLDRTAFTAQETLRAAGLKWSDIDRVLLVGGATRMPGVVEMLTLVTGHEPERSIAPDEAVAHGAALYAGMLVARLRGEPTPFSIVNVNSHSLGIVANDPRTKQKRNVILIRRNTPLPAVHRRVFHTHKDGQRSLLLQIVEGESKSPDECSQVGRCTVHDLPPNLPARSPVEVEFTYTESGRLRINVVVQGSNKRLQQTVASDNRLSATDLKAWRKAVSGNDTDGESSAEAVAGEPGKR